MKIYLFAFFLICFNAISQNSGTFIYVTDNVVLYRGYHNPVEFGVTGGSNYRVVLDGLELTTDTIVYSGQNGQGSDIIRYYLLVTGSGRYGTVTFIDTLRNDTLGIHQFRLSNLPDPTLYWGTSKKSELANIRSKKLYVKYPPDVPMKAVFSIKTWSLKVKNDTITGIGNNLTKAEKLLKKVKKRTTVEIEVIVIGPDGINRKLNGSWQVNPWKDEKVIENVLIDCSG